MRRLRHFGPAAATFALTLCGSAAALAQTPTESEPAETFEYRAPQPKTYLRGVLEFQAIYAFGLLWYMSDVVGWDPQYNWETFERKLTSGKLTHDYNGFGTNFRGHAVGGTGYYLIARSNRLSVPESFGIAVLGSVAWEYFGEVSEKVSLNDVIFTPLSGTAIAESFTQLGSYFDRRGASTANRVLGAVFAPVKTLNDFMDGAQLSRRSAGDSRREWHEFPLQVGVAAIGEGGNLAGAARAGEVRLQLSERLARLPGYDSASQRSFWFDDAQLSGITLGAAFAPHGLSDFVFEPHAVMAGHYSRSATGEGGALRGWGYATGLRVGFTYQVHDYRRAVDGLRDFSAFVEPLGWFWELRHASGGLRLRVALDAGAEYGGMHPLAQERFEPGSAELPRELVSFNYYFALGARVRSRVEVAIDGVRFDASGATWGFGSVDEHVQIPISDGFSRVGAGLSYGTTEGFRLRAFVDRSLRYGRMGEARAEARELALGGEALAYF
jgi:Domain of unknown function (DUF3943)